MRKVFILSLVIFLGCAYFNTFYNAKTYFKTAEKKYWETGKLTPELRKSYEKTIEKCARIIQYYPHSKYVDDAIYYMGVSYVRLGEKDKAKRKFEELFTYYPESPYIERARLEYGRVLIELGDWGEAENILRKVGEKYKDEALLLLGKSLYLAGDYKRAIEKLKYFEGRKKSPLKKEAYYYLALAAKEAGDFNSAEKYLREYIEEFMLTSEEAYRAKNFLGEILMDIGKYDEAIKVFQSMDLAPTSKESRIVLLKIGMCYEGLGEMEKAVESYKNVIERAASSEEALEARYRLGRLYESIDSLKLSLKYYDEASKMYVKSFYREEALRRAKALRALSSLGDQSSVEDRVKLAEIYLFELNKPEEALKIYVSILNDFPDTKWKPKVLYSLIYIYSLKGEKENAKKYYEQLLREFPRSYYTEKAKIFFEKSFM